MSASILSFVAETPESACEHDAIIAAMWRGDAAAAELATEQNCRHSAHRLVRVIARAMEFGGRGGSDGPQASGTDGRSARQQQASLARAAWMVRQDVPYPLTAAARRWATSTAPHPSRAANPSATKCVIQRVTNTAGSGRPAGTPSYTRT